MGVTAAKPPDEQVAKTQEPRRARGGSPGGLSPPTRVLPPFSNGRKAKPPDEQFAKTQEPRRAKKGRGVVTKFGFSLKKNKIKIAKKLKKFVILTWFVVWFGYCRFVIFENF